MVFYEKVEKTWSVTKIKRAETVGENYVLVRETYYVLGMKFKEVSEYKRKWINDLEPIRDL